MAKALRCVLWLGVVLIILGAVSCNFSSTTGETEGGDATATAESADIPEPGTSPLPAVSPVPVDPAAPENTDGAEVILIPGGKFWMGSESTDELADEDELPQHEVTLDGFYIYTHEVTNAMYAECVAAGACPSVNVLYGGPTRHYDDADYEDFPVVGVDWNMADDYCTWAGARLPTEAEWERASRGAESLAYPWGEEDPDCDRVNMLGCAIPPDTVEVGSYLLGNSPEGVWDMSGNAWEWVHDWYAENYYLFSPAFDPLGPSSYQDVHNPLKVVRGGGLFSEPGRMRSAERVGVNPYRVYDDVGFRCVTPPGLDLPEEFVPTRDRHERVPDDPDGGEHVDDPGGGDWVAFGTMQASCPTTEGTMQVLIAVDFSVPDILWDVVVEGSTLSCTYDDVGNLLNCFGPVPANNDELSQYSIVINTSLAYAWYTGYLEKPSGCTAFTPPSGTVDMDCPEDGLVNVRFQFVPQIRWTTIQLAGRDITCVPFSDNELRCTAPDLRSGDLYDFHLLGVDAAGQEYEWNPGIPVRADCPMAASRADISVSCREEIPLVNVLYMPEAVGISSVSAGGVDLSCVSPAPNVQVCIGLTGSPGDPVQVRACTLTGTCFTENLITPTCPTTESSATFLLQPYCLPAVVPSPAVYLYHYPSYWLVDTASVGSTTVRHYQEGPGWETFVGFPGSLGETVMLDFCFEGFGCNSGTFVFPDCSVPTEPGASNWRIAGIGCRDERNIYFIVDTYLEWLVPGAAFSFNASDGEVEYRCTVHPTIPGRLYCSGHRPVSPDPLELCLQRGGSSSLMCVTYEDYPTWVGNLPSCTPDVPPVVPPPPPSCSDLGDAKDCFNAGCAWDGSTCSDPPSPALALTIKSGIYKIIRDIFFLGDDLIDPDFRIFSLLSGK